MSTFTLSIGLVIRDGQRTWRLDRTLADSRLVFLDLENGAPKTISAAELQRDVLAGRLIVVQEHPVALAKQAESETRLVKTVQDLPAKEQRRLKQRLAYVKYMLRRGIQKGMRALITVVLKERPAELDEEPPEGPDTHCLPPPSASSVMAWMRTYDQSGGNPFSLISGNTFKQPRSRLNRIVLEIARRKVTITVVVDSCSGYIAGFFISFWSAGLASALSAFKVAIRPKDFLTENARLTHPWLAYGIPDLMVVDNGLEFHSPHFHAAAMHLAIDIQHCAVRQPWLKPMVERTIGEINGFLPVSGRVEKQLDNYLPEKPEKTACITFSSLCMGLLKAVVDVHPFEVNERRLDRAYDLYGEGLSTQLAPRLASSFDQLDIIMASSKTLTVGNEGVVKDYLRYNSRELQDLRRRVGLGFRTMVKFNPEDIGHVWIQDPVAEGWLRVPSCQPEYTDGLSVVQHKAIRALKRNELTVRNAGETLMRGRLEVMDIWSSALRHGKRQKGNFLKAAAGFTSSTVLGNMGQPERLASSPPLIPITKDELLPLPKETVTYAFD